METIFHIQIQRKKRINKKVQKDDEIQQSRIIRRRQFQRPSHDENKRKINKLIYQRSRKKRYLKDKYIIEWKSG